MRIGTSCCVLTIVGALGCSGDSKPTVASQLADLGPEGPSGGVGVDRRNGMAWGAVNVPAPSSASPMKPKLPFDGLLTRAAKSPLPISGGTLVALADASMAVVSDPDRDSVYVVDLATNRVSATIALQPGDEP